MSSQKMPSVFIGHGSPMNAISDNAYTQLHKKWSAQFPVPQSILAISAHWVTDGSFTTAQKNPKTIHDFYGFPEKLFQVQYPAPGNPLLAAALSQQSADDIRINSDWGLDHGTWSVLTHLYPKADIPVVQLSLNRNKTFKEHFELAKELRKFRSQGVMILGSGNLVHNLREIKWDDNSPSPDWALEFDAWVKEAILKQDWEALTNPQKNPLLWKKAHPTDEHYLPILYSLGAMNEDERAHFEIEGMQNSSISMRSFNSI